VAQAARPGDCGPAARAGPGLFRDPFVLWDGDRWLCLDRACRANGGAGCLTLPREVLLRDGQLSIRPIQELTQLREAHVGAYRGDLSETAPVTLVPDAGTGFDVEAEP
jgi:hypothetical protein